jgi:hypothetical protein
MLMVRVLAAWFVWACLVLALASSSFPQSLTAVSAAQPLPSRETLSYLVEWRLIYAGNARLTLDSKGPASNNQLEAKVHLESAGLVSKLYRLEDEYDVEMRDQFCADSTDFNAAERTRHRETKVEYDRNRGKASYVERDLLKNSIIKTAETDIPACVSDIIGALYKLRTIRLDPGQSTQFVLSDGKKTASSRVEAQAREEVKIKAGTYQTVRYEASIFNGVLYARKAQLLIWLTDDARKLPVQIRARMSFPIGSITLELEKEEHSPGGVLAGGR